MADAPITDQEFALFQRLIYKIAGISLSDAKKVLLVGRLQKRLRAYQLDTYSQYYRMLASGQNPEELQIMVDLLTTNETYFFREPKHFEFLRDEILAKRRSTGTFRAWSAASSSGEEAYTLAMMLAEHLPNTPWEIVGSDISTHVLEKARRGHYPLGRHEGIPPNFLSKYCLKGVRAQEGSFLIVPELRSHVSFQQVNLTLPVDKEMGLFEVIFLRNVMIYFDIETKRKVVQNLLPHLAPGGHLVIGHSETLNGISDGLTAVRATVYRKT
ncbi:CheR family methyltransferase [Dechloromonas denitrificans]|uniref:CheR family methyltransferase n=1 Tax=Azonexaceae TaxID=2008795 RepID=UPI001CF85F4A|nr:protein-glutamate O-methyltransferase CheR [Dechloromonas denitrificans]UCV04183.1 protein-glutamate O-methyltransferase CheR [Dechloromonas denitrificans]UCV08454.1 protein-glutamate O-methyltransferase CheR [Dechloromonas denitrificans]